MFDFFNKDKETVKVIDRVWISTGAKWNACRSLVQLNPDCVFAAWFESTKQELESFLSSTAGHPAVVHLATKLSSDGVLGKMIVFVEHYPFRKKELEVFSKLVLAEVPVLSALDEPIMMFFGGEKVIDLMKRLGMKDDEPIGHSMVTKSISSAQRKIAEKVEIEKPASSPSQWFALNLPTNTI